MPQALCAAGVGIGSRPELAADLLRAPRTLDCVEVVNHRLLHGRRAFDDPGRDLRLLVWRRDPFPAPEAWRGRASRCAPAPHPPDP